mmetsp:Transcript_26516/g.74048  ORF Transcript_26516/g.74048 Transcript_26516/m.74048 type:complete len:207 (-) Transcript_26516:259-879(-)
MTMTGHQGAIWCVDMEWTSRLALTGSADQDVRLWNLESGACIRRMRGHAGPVRCLAVDWRARRALSGGRDDTALIWAFECDNPPVLDLPEHKPLVLCVGLHYATHRAITGDEGGNLRLWDIGNETADGVFTAIVMREMRGLGGAIHAVAVDWRWMRAVSGDDQSLCVWDLDAGVCQFFLRGHVGAVLGVDPEWPGVERDDEHGQVT